MSCVLSLAIFGVSRAVQKVMLQQAHPASCQADCHSRYRVVHCVTPVLLYCWLTVLLCRLIVTVYDIAQVRHFSSSFGFSNSQKRFLKLDQIYSIQQRNLIRYILVSTNRQCQESPPLRVS